MVTKYNHGYFLNKEFKKQDSQSVTPKGNLAVQRCWTSERVYQLIYKLSLIYLSNIMLSTIFKIKYNFYGGIFLLWLKKTVL